jgi:hypothetical protein
MNTLDPDFLVEMFSSFVRQGLTPDQAYRKLCIGGIPADQVKRAQSVFEAKVGQIRSLKEPYSLEGHGLYRWYLGPDPEGIYWPALHQLLLLRNWSSGTITSLDDASTKVVSLLQPPGLGKINTRGLVLGYVQSGKTANFSAVIAKASDAGYKFFIVLSGLTNLLRSQTQLRLERELINLNREKWFTLTEVNRDFIPGPIRNVNAFLTEYSGHKLLCVVKKNASVLRRLLSWLKAASSEVLGSCPILIIDDEADQASVNASGSEDRRTVINRLLMQILAVLPKAAYVGYTATPFANVFIDPKVPEDLYPRDFIVDLPKPAGYFGAEQIFGRERLNQDESEQEFDGLDMIRHIDEYEIPFLTPPGKNARYSFQPELTSSLEKALRYFWMATAARFARGDSDAHSTMLIHTSLYIEVHERFRHPVENYRKNFAKVVSANNASLFEELKAQWHEEQTRVPPGEVGEQGTSFDELQPYLYSAVNKSEVVVENSQSIQRLEYGDEARVQIVIGGNTLSRGLTLEGLVVSFFVRATNAYDTLLQMGRWFGYRQGYADLPRVWMTEELEGYFYDLATVEQEIRNDIKRYESEAITPLEFAVRIRTHPALEITSRLKMQAAIDCDVSFSDQQLQTILFKHKDQTWLTKNINAAKLLIRQINDAGIKSEAEVDNNILFRNVPVQIILAFLQRYAFHENNTILQEKLLRDYIVAQNIDKELLRWNVVIIGRKMDGEDDVIDLGLDHPVPLLVRSQFIAGQTSGEYANLKAIFSSVDRVADLGISRDKLSGKGRDELQSMRSLLPGVGLLLLYPISKDSKPKSPDNPKRKELNAVEHLIGISLVFPRAKTPTPQRYKTVDLSGLVHEEPEWPEEEEENGG